MTSESTPRSRTRRLINAVTPPIMLSTVRRLRAQTDQAPEYEYLGTSWPEASALRGWDMSTVVDRHRSQWPEVRRLVEGTKPLTNGGLVPHNTIMCFAYVVGLALFGKPSLSMLDWGGGTGAYALYARALYPEMDLDYHCRELPLISSAGRELVSDGTFHDTDESAFSQRYDLAMASASLHYSEGWSAILGALAASSDGYVFVTRQPFVEHSPSFVVVQRPAVTGYYDTEYPGWCLNRSEFLGEAARLGLRLRREFLTGEEPAVAGAPEQAVYRGFLFESPRR